MYICIARIRKKHLLCTVNETLTTGKQVGFQSPSKLIWPNSWIAQTVRQWIPDCRTSRSEGATTEGVAADMWNGQLMAAGGSQVPATGNIGHWNAVVLSMRGNRCRVFEARCPFSHSLKTSTGPHAFFNHQQTPEW